MSYRENIDNLNIKIVGGGSSLRDGKMEETICFKHPSLHRTNDTVEWLKSSYIKKLSQNQSPSIIKAVI